MAFTGYADNEVMIFVGIIWTLPVIQIGLSVGAWIAFAKRKNTLAAVLSGSAFAPLLLYYLLAGGHIG